MKNQQKGKATSARASSMITGEERAAMRETVRERKAAAAGSDGEAEVLAKIAEMAPAERAMAERLHALIKAAGPDLLPRTWYGMPAYAKDGDVLCFFQPASKFKARYSTLGFNGRANLDEGNMWPTAYALTQLTPADEARVTALVKKAVN